MWKLELQATGRDDPDASHRLDEARWETDRPHNFSGREADRQQAGLNNHRRSSTKYAWAEVGDNNTKVLLESILKEEEDHIDWIEAQLDQIKQMGVENYLAEQIYWGSACYI